MFAVDQFSIVCRKCMRDCSGFDLLRSVIAVQKICATSQLISCKTKTNHDLIGRVSAFWAVCFFFTIIIICYFEFLSFDYFVAVVTMVLVPRHPINKRCIYRGLYTNGQSQLLYDAFSCFFIKWDEKVLVPFRHYYLTCYMPADSLALKLIAIGCWVIKWPWITFLYRFLTRKNQFPSQKRSWEEITNCVINPTECLKVTRIWIWTKLLSNWRRIMKIIWISLLTRSFHPCENHAWISWH